MSDTQQPAAPAPAVENPTIVEPAPQATENAAPEAAAAADPTEAAPAVPANAPADPAAVGNEDEIAPVQQAEQQPEPLTEGVLQYKSPPSGLFSRPKFMPAAKKEFWISEEPIADLDLASYLREENSEDAKRVAAWAQQTPKGLIFFSKPVKGEHNRTHPSGVLAMYEATDLKKQGNQEMTFKIHGAEHGLKAASESDRDRWYLTLERSIEIGRASRESIENHPGYKAELERLNKPFAPAAVAHAKNSQAQQSKSDAAAAEPAEEAVVVPEEDKKEEKKEEKKPKNKSRSTSRGVLNRFKAKKEEVEEKKEEKKEEKEEQKEEEKKAEESKEDDKAAEVAVPAAGAAVVAGGVVAAEEDKKDTTDEPTAAPEAKPQEKSKAAKRTSIFGSLLGKKEQKEPKETQAAAAEEPATIETAPQLPEASATEATETAAVVEPVEASKPANEPKADEERVTPGKEKKNFLSGLSFAKRGRSVSPSQKKMEETKTEAAPEEVAEASKTDEASAAAVVVPVVVPAAEAEAESTEKPEEKATEEAPKTETPTANKRQSVFGNIGRRASNYMKGFQGPRKENATPKATEETKEDATEETTKAAATEEKETPAAPAAAEADSKPVEEDIAKQQQIGDVVPEAVNVGQPQQQQSTPVIAASA